MQASSSSSSASKPSRIRYQVLLFACTLSMVTYLDRVCFGTAATAIAKDLSLSGVSDLKWAFTAFAIAYAIFEVPAGWWGDRLGPRGMLLRIVIWWSICTALTGLVGLQWGSWTLGGLGTLIFIRFLFGAGEAGAYPNITRALHNWFPRSQWEMAQGMVWMSGRIMGGLTPLLWALLVAGTAYTQPLMNWRGAFLLFGAVGLFWCLLFFLFFRNTPSEDSRVHQLELEQIYDDRPPAEPAHGAIPWKLLLTNRHLWALCLMYSLVNYGWAFNITYLPAYLQQRFHLPEQDLWGAIYKGAPLWVGAIGCLLSGWIVNWLSLFSGSRVRGRQILGCSALLFCAGLWFLAHRAENIHLFCFSIAAAAFCVDLTLGSAWATCQDLGGKHTAVVAACMNTVGTIGAAAAGWLTGTLVERAVILKANLAGISPNEMPTFDFEQAILSGYQTVFSTYAIVYLVAGLCWLLILPKKSFDQ